MRTPVRCTAITLLASAVALAPATASAKRDAEGRPWARGTLSLGGGIGFGFSEDLTVLGLGIGAGYFVAHGFELGLRVHDTQLFWSDGARMRLPGLQSDVPTNMFELLPFARWVPFRSRGFSPYIQAGVGPVFLNHGGGVMARWEATPGAYIGIVGPVYLDLGVTFASTFTAQRCADAFAYRGDPNVISPSFCGFRWGPRIGLGVGF